MNTRVAKAEALVTLYIEQYSNGQALYGNLLKQFMTDQKYYFDKLPILLKDISNIVVKDYNINK